MPADWVKQGEVDNRPAVARVAAKAAGTFLAVEGFFRREAKPAVDSVDVEAAPVPARAQAKADGTFGTDAPYEQRDPSARQ